MPGIKQNPRKYVVAKVACLRGKRSWKRARSARVSRFQSVDSFPAGYENETFPFPPIPPDLNGNTNQTRGYPSCPSRVVMTESFRRLARVIERC